MKTFSLLIFLLCAHIAFAQQSDNEKIKQVYGSAEPSLSTKQLTWIKNCLSRCEVIQAENLPSSTKAISEIPLNEKYNSLSADSTYEAATFNPLKYNFDFYSNEDQYFLLFDSGKALRIKAK